MTKFGSSLVLLAGAAAIASGQAASALADTQPATTGVHVELAADLTASERAKFDRIGGRDAVARAVVATLIERSELAECGENITITVTDYRLSRAPWSGSGRAARPYRAVSSGQKDKISAVIALRGNGEESESVVVEAYRGVHDTRLRTRLDNLVEQLADEVGEALSRKRDSWC